MKMPRREFSAVLLAGGASARMGQPKATLRFGDAPLLERIVNELSREFVQVVVVAAPEKQEPFVIRQLLPEAGAFVIVRDDGAYQGPVEALARGLHAAASDVAFACSCDLPLLRAEVARALCLMLDGYDAVIPNVGGLLQPLHAAYRRRCADVLAAMAAGGERRLTALASRVAVRRVGEAELRRLDPELRSVFNVNTPADYAQALRLAGFAREP